jgi:hypothetical protein
MTQEPIAYINVEKRTLEFAEPIKWHTPTVANLDRIALYTKDTFLQLIKELRPAIKPLEGMGKGKTTDEWFDILVKDIEEKNNA